MEGRNYEYVVVGSGMGGASVAGELVKRGKDVLVLETGKRETSIGHGQDAVRFYDGNALTKMPKHSKEGVIVWRTLMAGGSTVVSCANGCRALQNKLAELGIPLEEEFVEMEAEMGIAPIAPKLLSEGSAALKAAADHLGYSLQPMPKFINADKCEKCGNCVLGCTRQAKWTALDQLDFLESAGGLWEPEITVDRVVIENGRALGVEAHRGREKLQVMAGTVILAAGGVGTPIILQASGIEAGKGLFIDSFVNTYAITKGLNQLHEPTMALVGLDWHDDRGFLISPMSQSSRVGRVGDMGKTAFTTSPQNTIGMMTKISDERAGTVYPDSTISKAVTASDSRKLEEGSARCREILVQAGGNPKSVWLSKIQGAHPGGTAAIGEVVDANLETKVSGLFVCDASVLPMAPGLPPILTLGALGKYLGKR